MEVPGFPDDLAQCTGFQWDAGNADKNRDLHQVSQGECEQVFFNRPLLVAPDSEHSQREPRYAALGQTNAARRLALVFTIRETLIVKTSASRRAALVCPKAAYRGSRCECSLSGATRSGRLKKTCSHSP